MPAVLNPPESEVRRVCAAVAAGKFKPAPGEHVIICKDRHGSYYNHCIFRVHGEALEYKAALEAENRGCSFELFSGRDLGERQMMLFIFLLFDRRNAVHGRLPTKHVEFLPVVADDPEQDEDARWANLRLSHNSPETHLQKVMVLTDDEDGNGGQTARTLANLALLGALAMRGAAEQSEKEKTDPTYPPAEKEGA